MLISGLRIKHTWPNKTKYNITQNGKHITCVLKGENKNLIIPIKTKVSKRDAYTFLRFYSWKDAINFLQKGEL